MSWRDQLQAASFRGVPFFVDSHEANLGRRVHVHEFPLRDKPFAEDLGRKARNLTVQAFVLGGSYMTARDRLVAAIEKSGPGLLVHPYLGELQCTVLECKLSESTAEGGLARFALTLVEAGDAAFPSTAPSTTATVVATAEQASTSAVANFNKRHSVAGKPAFVAAASGGIFKGALSGIQSAVSLVRGAADQVAALQRDVDAARRDWVTLIYAPASASQALLAAVKQLVRGVASTPEDSLSLARVLYRFGDTLPDVKPSTTSRKAQASNQLELVRLVHVVAVAEGARATAGLDFASYQDAIKARDEITATLDDVLLADGVPDDLFDALRALRSAVVRDVTARGANLARVVNWTPAITAPSLALAQQLYADGRREGELVARNRVRHPLFVAGSVALEVLADE